MLKALVALVRADETWALDVETAQADLRATGSQASLIAAHALAWRSSVALLPMALFIASLAVALGGKDVVAALVLALLLPVLGPQALALLVTLPVDFLASGQALFRGRDNFVRFGVTNVSYPYYGWRYAFCNRTRQWGALTYEERVARDPHRAGVQTEAPPRRNYWPE
jgi:hypothetical protein